MPRPMFPVFHPEWRGRIAIEIEFFLTDATGMPVPRSEEFLLLIADDAWTYELSACQVEFRTKLPPCKSLSELGHRISVAIEQGRAVASRMGLELRAMPVAPANMPLDIYPRHPRRGIMLAKGPEAVLAACRIAAIHFHIAVKDMTEAITVHNLLARKQGDLIVMGGEPSGRGRIFLYRQVLEDSNAPIFAGSAAWINAMESNGWIVDLRRCHFLIRITQHGTVEVRVCDATDNIPLTLSWGGTIMRIAGL